MIVLGAGGCDWVERLTRLQLSVLKSPWGTPRGRGWSAKADVAVNCKGLSCAQLSQTVTNVVGVKNGPFEWTIYSDVTLGGGTGHDSGAAVVVTRELLSKPELVEVLRSAWGEVDSLEL